MKRLLALVCVLALSVQSASCQAPRAAQSTPVAGSLVVLGSAEEEYVRGMCRAFELETGIQTSYVRLSAGEALVRLRSQREAPRYSVWWGGSADGYIAADAEGLLDAYEPRGAAKGPRQYRDPNSHWTGVYVGTLAFGVNRRVLSERGLPTPSRWNDLTDPVYRGQIAMAHPATSGTAYTALATVTQIFDRDVDRALAYFADLNANVREYPRAGSVPARMAGRGDVAIGIAFAHDIVAAIEEGFADLDLVFPSEGTGYEIGAMALVKNAPDAATGRRFMDWAMSDKAQELGPLFTAYQIPTNPDAKVPAKSVRLSAIKTIDFDFRWSGEHRDLLIQRFSQLAPAPM